MRKNIKNACAHFIQLPVSNKKGTFCTTSKDSIVKKREFDKDSILLLYYCETAVVSMPRLANFSPCNRLISHFLCSQLVEKRIFSNVHG